MNLNIIADQIHDIAKENGFWDHAEGNPSIDGEKIALMHSELSEALEAMRNSLYYEIDGAGSVQEELADTIIRILDYSAYMNFDMEGMIERKVSRNNLRQRLHGKAF